MKSNLIKIIAFVNIFSAIKAAAIFEAEKCAGMQFWHTDLQRIEQNVDDDLSPCQDFHEYACGKWRATYEYRALGARDALTLLKADNKRVLMQYFEEAEEAATTATTTAATTIENSTEAATEATTAKAITTNATIAATNQIVTQFYQACLKRLQTNSSESISVYANALKQLHPIWPIISANFSAENFSANFDWLQINAELGLYGVQTFWRLLVQSNWQAADEQIFYLAAPIHESRHAEESKFFYRQYVKYIMLSLGVRVRQANEIAEQLLAFKEQLLELTLFDEQSAVLKAPQTLESLLQEFAAEKLDLQAYFKILLQDFAHVQNMQQILIVADKQYLKRLVSFLSKSPMETIAKYMLIEFLAHFELLLHEEATTHAQKEYCLQQTNTFLPNELSTLFAQLQYGANVTAALQAAHMQLNALFAQLKQQFGKWLNATEVFESSNSTRAANLEKLQAMRLLLPQLEELEERSSNNLVLHENYDINLMNLNKLRMRKQLSKVINTLQQLPNVNGNAYGPLSVNAYYRLQKNAIELPIGLLRSNSNETTACPQPAIMHGSLAYILAHELLHGFDYDGLNYDRDGNIANNWNAKSIIRYGIRSRCYLTQDYSKNTAATINENIADSEGLRLALDTLLESGGAVSERNIQLFFISFAQIWCGNEPELPAASSDMHSTHKQRVNSVVHNFALFAEAFKCQADADTCSIW